MQALIPPKSHNYYTLFLKKLETKQNNFACHIQILNLSELSNVGQEEGKEQECISYVLSIPTLAVLEASQGNFSNSGHRCLIVSSISLQLTIFLKFHLLPRINKTSTTLDCGFYFNQKRTTFTFLHNSQFSLQASQSQVILLIILLQHTQGRCINCKRNNIKLKAIPNSPKELIKTSGDKPKK